MSESVTLQDIYDLFRRSQEEADRRFAEADRRTAEIEQRLAAERAEADRRAAEARAEAQQRLAYLEALVAQATQAVNALTSRWGQFVENLVAPGVVRVFQERGIGVYKTAQRVRAKKGGEHLEIDVLATNGTEVVVVEVKSRLTQKQVRQCLKNLDRFKTFFPEYQNHCVYGAIAAIEIDSQVDTFAHNQGLFVIQQAGDHIAISNPTVFMPRTW